MVRLVSEVRPAMNHPVTIVLAPLRGVTIRAFREEFAPRFGGVDAALAPFIPTVAGDRIQPKLLRDVERAPAVFPNAVPQLIGKDPAQLSAMLRALRDIGHTAANLNAGCPWKFVARKGRGSGLLATPDVLRRMLDVACEEFPGAFSVKVRLGLVPGDRLLESCIPIFNSYPLSELIIHPRTAQQMYGGDPDLDRLDALLPECRLPVVYNGDIFTVEDFARVRSRYPSISRFMVGRGLVAKSLLAEQIKATPSPTPESGLARIRDFHDALYARACRELFGPASILGRMKELWGYLHRSTPGGADGLRAIQRSHSLRDYETAVSRCFEPRMAARNTEARP